MRYELDVSFRTRFVYGYLAIASKTPCRVVLCAYDNRRNDEVKTTCNNEVIYMRALHIGILFVFLSTFMSAQGWERVYPAWDVDRIKDVLHWNEDTLFACGDNMTLLRSVDAGLTWTEMLDDELTRTGFVSMHRIGRKIFLQRGWLEFGDDAQDYEFYCFLVETGELLDVHTEYSGSGAYSTNFTLRGSDNTLTIIERSLQPFIHRSTDEGLTWDHIALPGNMLTGNYINLHWFSDSVGVLTARDSSDRWSVRLYRTTDGGRRWNQIDGMVQPNASSVFSSFRFGGSVRTMMGLGPFVWISNDEGISWTKTSEIPWQNIGNVRVLSIAQYSESTTYVIGSEADTYKTTDGGQSWVKVMDAGWSHYTSSRRASDIVVGSNNEVLISTMEGLFYRSDDEGLTWDVVHCPEIRVIDELHFFDEMNGLMIGLSMDKDPITAVTTDGGASWSKIRAFPYDGMLSNRTTALWQAYRIEQEAQSATFTLWQSTDQGTVWTEMHGGEFPAKEDEYFSIVQSGDLILLGFVTDEKQGVYRSTDRGDTWAFESVSDTLFTSYGEMDCALDANGVVICYSINKLRRNAPVSGYSTLYKSLDSGRTWTALFKDWDPAIYRFVELDVISSDTLAIRANLNASSVRRLYLTYDGGTNWEQYVDTLSRSAYQYVYRLPYVYANATSFRIYRTDNLWKDVETQIKMNKGGYVTQLYFLSQDIGWAYAGNIIYRTTTGGVNTVPAPGTLPDEPYLGAVYPNPIAPGQAVTVSFSAGMAGNEIAHITVTDVLGRLVGEVYNNRSGPGRHTATWQPQATLPAGLYFVRMRMGEMMSTKQLVIMR